MRRPDVVSFGAGLEASMHLCKASNRAKAAFKKALHEVSIYFLVSLPARLLVCRLEGPHVVGQDVPCSRRAWSLVCKLQSPCFHTMWIPIAMPAGIICLYRLG